MVGGIQVRGFSRPKGLWTGGACAKSGEPSRTDISESITVIVFKVAAWFGASIRTPSAYPNFHFTPGTNPIKKPIKETKIVVIGGGSGTSAVLRGLKRHTSRLTAVVTMFDSGGSSGLLQKEFGYPPLGDLRQCLLGLSEDHETAGLLREALGFRFSQESSLNGHSLGNLWLAALTDLGSDLEQAVNEMAGQLRITGQVIPVSLERADLCAELGDGSIIRGESPIDLRGKRCPRIRRVFLDPAVPANPRAIQAIFAADAVVLGPGDLYTSVIPNLLAGGIAQALAATRATRIYVCNLMTKLGETDDFKASDFVREIIHYMSGPCLDWALINARPVPEEVQQAYQREVAKPVEGDLEEVQRHVPGVFATGLGNGQVPLQHDPEQIAEAVLSIAGMGRVPKTFTNRNGHRSDLEVPELPTSLNQSPKSKQLQ